VNTELAQLQSEKESQDSEVITREEDLRGQRRRLADLHQNRSVLEIELVQKNVAGNIRQRVRENISQHRRHPAANALPSRSPMKAQQRSNPHARRNGHARTGHGLGRHRQQVTAMQRRIDDMGR